jgi:hypothetical protein
MDQILERPQRNVNREVLPQYRLQNGDLDVSGQQGASTSPSPPPEDEDVVNPDHQIPQITDESVRATSVASIFHGLIPSQVRLPGHPDSQIPQITPEPVRSSPVASIRHDLIPPQVRNRHRLRQLAARQNPRSRESGEEDLGDNLGTSVCTQGESIRGDSHAFRRQPATISHDSSSGITTLCFYSKPQTQSSCPVLDGRPLDQGPQSLGYLDSQIYFREGNGDTHTLSLSSQKPSYSELNRR